MECFERVISMNGKLKGKVRRDRRLLLLLSLAFLLGLPFAFVPPLWPLHSLTVVPALVLSLLILGACVCSIDITRRMMRLMVCVGVIHVILLDFNMRTIGNEPAWPFYVLLADLSLVLDLGNRFATRLIMFVALWVVVTYTELMVRVGFLDLPGSAPNWHRWDRARAALDCSDPPCPVAVSKGVFEMVSSLFVLLIDFGATRGFAESASQEQAIMLSTIETVEAIAELLAGYDVDKVAEMLQEAEGRLPPAMHGALQRLEQNLRSYQPYLPAILVTCQMTDMHVQSPHARDIAPGAECEHAAVVFTDIRASTSVWEADPVAMKKGMHVHNSAVRQALSQWGGYEVKTIGDAFMVAFKDAKAGVHFGLAVQEALLAAEWPPALLEVDICRATRLWGGLTVRIGVNEGPVTMETNAITGRVDYFGHTVNVAARLEGVCIPGAVAVPAELWDCIRASCTDAHASPPVATNLKGVHKPVAVHNVWPSHLRGREHEPLRVDNDNASYHDSSSLHRAAPSRAPVPLLSVTRQHATLAAVTLRTTVMCDISDMLAGVVPLLDRSAGVLLSLVGNHLFVGWNVGQEATDAESALRFAQRVIRLDDGSTLGMASGKVQYGDVGTGQQRFLTASGPPVESCLMLQRAATQAGVPCLYAAAELSGAVLELLRPCPRPAAAEAQALLGWEVHSLACA